MSPGGEFQQEPGGAAGGVENLDDGLEIRHAAFAEIGAMVRDHFGAGDGGDHSPLSFLARMTRRPLIGSAVKMTLKPLPSWCVQAQPTSVQKAFSPSAPTT